MKLSIVIPVYNSDKILDELVRQIKNNVTFTDDYEVIFVNDNSSDESWRVLKKLYENHDFIKAINLRKNTGQHNAIMAGLRMAKGDVIIMMDDDLQHDPRYIFGLYKEIINGKDVCYTNYINRRHKGWKVLGSKFNDLVANILLKKPKNIYMSSYKAISNDIKNEMIDCTTPNLYIDGLILSISDDITSIPIEHNERFQGEGQYTFKKSVSLWLKMATSFSILPLRVATVVGIVFSLISFFMIAYFIFLKIVYDTAPEGWTSIMVVVLFIGGIQLLSLGIIGEYVGKMYLSNSKKQYIVKEVLE